MNKQKVLLRADGNTQMGLGHIYRCIAVAEMLSRDFDCEFLLAHTSQFKNVIPSQFPVKYIPPTVALNSEPEWVKENYITGLLVLILDGYQFNSDYQKKLKNTGLALVYIDDFATEHMFADAVINHSPSANETLYKREDHTKLFLGLQYALLRQGFLQKAKHVPSVFNETANVLITLGGSDEHNITLKILEALLQVQQIKKIDIVIGAAYTYKEKLVKHIGDSSKQIHLFSNLSEVQMIGLMSACDSAFAPSSNTCLELFAINKPVFAGISANNQSGLYTYFKDNDLIFDLGDLQKTSVKEIKETVEANIHNSSSINKMLNLQKQLLDGHSGERIVKLVKDLVK